jgi:CRP-like cAMP-binding protein
MVDFMAAASFKKNEVIIKEGDTDADHFYIIDTGKVSVEKDGEKLCEFGEGEGVDSE